MWSKKCMGTTLLILLLAIQQLSFLINVPPKTEVLEQEHVTNEHATSPDDIRVAFAITVTECHVYTLDGAAVLAESISSTQPQVQANGQEDFFQYEMVAILYPDPPMWCLAGLKLLGFRIYGNATLPFDPSEMKDYRTGLRIQEGGRSGALDFLKLHAFQMTDYTVVVHINTETTLTKDFSPLFDLMVNNHNDGSIKTMTETIPESIDVMFVRDYARINPLNRTDPSKYGLQTDFFLVRPDHARFKHLVSALLDSRYDPHRGWAGLGHGGYPGSAQVDGFLNYYLTVHRDTVSSIELDHCRFNTHGQDVRYFPDEQYIQFFENRPLTCRTGQPASMCEDCSKTPMKQIYAIRFSACQEPWTCPANIVQDQKCSAFQQRWFDYRRNVDNRLANPSPDEEQASLYGNKTFFYCDAEGRSAYWLLDTERLFNRETPAYGPPPTKATLLSLMDMLVNFKETQRVIKSDSVNGTDPGNATTLPESPEMLVNYNVNEPPSPDKSAEVNRNDDAQDIRQEVPVNSMAAEELHSAIANNQSMAREENLEGGPVGDTIPLPEQQTQTGNKLPNTEVMSNVNDAAQDIEALVKAELQKSSTQVANNEVREENVEGRPANDSIPLQQSQTADNAIDRPDLTALVSHINSKVNTTAPQKPLQPVTDQQAPVPNDVARSEQSTDGLANSTDNDTSVP